jgi:uncharacterized protein
MKSYTLFFFFFLLTFCSKGQETSEGNVNSLVTATFYPFQEEAPKRKFLSLKNKSFLSKINPFTYLSASALFVYQRLLSEQIQADCMYEISCSNYTKFQLEKNGLRGFLLGFHQFNNCVPSTLQDYSKNQINKDDKVINHIHKIGK